MCLVVKNMGKWERMRVLVGGKQDGQTEFTINVGDGRATITRFMLLLGLSRGPGMGGGWMGLTSRRPSVPREHSQQGGCGSVLGGNKHLKSFWGETRNKKQETRNKKRRLFKGLVAEIYCAIGPDENQATTKNIQENQN